MTEDEMVGWHHRLNRHGFGWSLGVGDGQGGLVCCSSWDCKELDTTERLNWTDRSLQENWKCQRNISFKDGHNKGQKLYTYNRSRIYEAEMERIHRTV